MTAAARRILLLYPKFPPTYWGMQYSLPLLGKTSIMPPLGLLTLAALTPAGHDFRVVDENCAPLTDDDLAWADLVCISAMLTQKFEMARLARRCREAGKRVILGGPYPTSSPDVCQPLCDALVAGEAETTWPQVIADLDADALQPRYEAPEKPDVALTPTPRFDLIDPQDYFTIPIQFSRGCPFQCEFCDIIVMFGRKPRTKTPAQIRAELDAVYAAGWRGDIFFVDDNFIGNKKKTAALLETLRAWNAERGDPFEYITEASVDLAQQPALLEAMVAARFRRVFLGIESPSAESLKETKKFQNLRQSLEASVHTIAAAGLNVMGGFIIGFDNDPEDIYQLQIDLISRLPIPLAMVARLEAVPGTPLHARMEREGRLIARGDAFLPGRVGHSNIVPRDDPARVLREYRRMLATIYDPPNYFARVLLANRVAPKPPSRRAALRELGRQLRVMLRQSKGLGATLRFWRGLAPDFRREARRLFWRLLRERPDRLGLYMTYLVVGHHMHAFTFQLVLGQLDEQLAELAAEPRRLPLAAQPA